jgi:hypothetical protein
MNGHIAVEKPHRRHGSAKDRRPPDLIQLHYCGKTNEIRLERAFEQMPISTADIGRPLPNSLRHATWAHGHNAGGGEWRT